jgi:RHS repeat-associated protein
MLGYGYDGMLLKQVQSSGEVNGTVAFGYDSDFRVNSLSVNGDAVAFGYDNDSLLTSAGAETLTRNVQNGLLTGSTLGSTTTTLGYNTFGELGSAEAKFSTTSLFKEQFTLRDKLGRIKTKVETVQGVTHTYQYGYDLAGRLESVDRDGLRISTYGYDSNGNRLSKNGTQGSYDAQDRMLSYGSSTFTYTANGELDSKTDPSGVTDYDYDVLGNLRRVALPTGQVIEYVIDGQNRRVGKKVDGTLVQGLLYQDQLEPVAELDGSGAVVIRFVYGTKAHVPDYLVKGGVTYRIVSDYLGSVRLVVNTTDGTIAQRMGYDEFGIVVEDTNPGFQPFGYAGGIYDRDTGLTRFGARDYDPASGRWTAKDPIGFSSGSLNSYSYSGSNPASYIDATGLDATLVYNRSLGYMFGYDNDGNAVTLKISENPTPGNSNDPNSEGGPLPEGLYNLNPRPEGLNNAGRPTFSSPGQNWNTIVTPNGSTRSGIQIHPGTFSDGCLLTSKEAYQQLLDLINDEYSDGGVTITVTD